MHNLVGKHLKTEIIFNSGLGAMALMLIMLAGDSRSYHSLDVL